jgi:hypothetical protein
VNSMPDDETKMSLRCSGNPEHYSLGHLTTAELERTGRELKANLGLITADSPAHVPIRSHLHAIDAELAERASHQQASAARS